MTVTSGTDPVAILKSLEERVQRRKAEPCPGTAPQRMWRGLGIPLAGRRVVVPVASILEVLSAVNVSHVPGTKRWLLGITRFRGGVLPVLDLQGLLCAISTPLAGGARTLVVREAGVLMGLAVAEVFGIKAFAENARLAPGSDDPAASRLQAFLGAAYGGPEGGWDTLDLTAVLASPELLEVAV